jgi:hypothetical protein
VLQAPIRDVESRFGPLPRATQTAGTAITVGVPPVTHLGVSPLPYRYGQFDVTGGRANWLESVAARTVITCALYTTGPTGHTITLLRPLNFCKITAAIAAGGTAITVDADPGVFSSNYRYPLPTGAVPSVADNAISTGDFVAYQLSDGTWVFDKIASGTFGGANLVLTTGVPNVTGVTVLANSPLFFFGIQTDTDPATGVAHPGTKTIASTNRVNQFDDGAVIGFGNALHPGDPLLLHSNNATDAGSFEGVAGYYATK